MTNLVLVYPLVFLVTTVSIFFRPAKGAILPRIVREDELLPANSALWVGETFADIGGYVLAALFVALARPALPLAFWVDAATYVASAVAHRLDRRSSAASRDRRPRPGEEPRPTRAPRRPRTDRACARFLRGETVLLANTLQATVGQFTIGVADGPDAVLRGRDRVRARSQRPDRRTGSSRRRSAPAT